MLTPAPRPPPKRTWPTSASGAGSASAVPYAAPAAEMASPKPAAATSARSAATKCTDESIRKQPGQAAASRRQALPKYLLPALIGMSATKSSLITSPTAPARTAAAASRNARSER